MISFVCRSCGNIGRPKRQGRGSGTLEMALWSTLVFPGALYSIYRILSRRNVCRQCGSEDVVDAESLEGHEFLMKDLNAKIKGKS